MDRSSIRIGLASVGVVAVFVGGMVAGYAIRPAAPAPAIPTERPTAAPLPAPAGEVIADLVLTNARIYTMDDRSTSPNIGTIASAMAVKDSRILAVGSAEQIAKLTGPNTQRVDLKGRAVIPGIIDTHSHLMDYAIDHWAADAKRVNVGPLKGETWQQVKSRALAVLNDTVRSLKPGEWVSMDIGREALGADGDPLDVKIALKDGLLTRAELDRIAPQNPVHVQGATRAVLNSKAIELVSPLTDEPDVIEPRSGFSQNTVNRIVKSDFLLPFTSLVDAYRRENEEWASYGVTTWSSSLRSARSIAAYEAVDRNGTPSIRFAFGSSIGTTTEGYPANSAGLVGYGTPFLWYNAYASSGPDGSYPEIATTADAPKAIKDREKFETEMFKLIEQAIGRGARWANTHIAGDRTLDALMDAIERGSKTAGLSPDQIKEKRHAADHCAVNPRPDQIARLVRLGMFMSCSPKYIENAPLVDKDYGPAVTRWVVPVNSLVKGGVRTVYELDSHDISKRGVFAFLGLLVDRTVDGKVWVPEERIDRAIALKMATSWASEYLFKEKDIGTLEAGKLADLVVLDRDYFDRQALPDSQLKAVRPVMTAIGGKLVFVHLSATDTGLKPAGFQPKYQ